MTGLHHGLNVISAARVSVFFCIRKGNIIIYICVSIPSNTLLASNPPA